MKFLEDLLYGTKMLWKRTDGTQSMKLKGSNTVILGGNNSGGLAF